MKHFGDSPFASLRGAIHRIADDAAASLRWPPSSLRGEVDTLRQSLEPAIDGFRHSAIGITGVFATDRSQSIALLLGQSIVEQERLTTTIARVTRHDVLPHEARETSGKANWQRALRPRSLNVWPSVQAQPEVRHAVDLLELLHWLRAESDCSIVTFDSLGDVITRLPLAKRLDGLLIVNSGRRFDLNLMSSASEMLERKGIRILGQVRNLRDGTHRDDVADREVSD